MSAIGNQLATLREAIPSEVKLIAVSKTKPLEDIRAAYEAGQRHFGENYVQEMVEKQPLLPSDIHWHFIGHLQSNKVKSIASFVHCIHGLESASLWKEIEKQAVNNQRTIPCLLQIHIAQEDSKFGLKSDQIDSFLQENSPAFYPHAPIIGVMGMASFTENKQQVKDEFRELKKVFSHLKSTCFQNDAAFREISMGMSGDWKSAVEEGSTMVRIGSSIFGNR